MTASNNEYVWSCGTRDRPTIATDQKQFPGLNLYGNVLYDLHEEVKHAGENPVSFRQPLETWLSRRQNHTYPPKTVFVLADSICRVVKLIDQGFVTSVSGGNFRTVADRAERDLAANNLRLEDFTYLVVHVGVNELKPWRGEKQQRDSWRFMRSLLRGAVDHGISPHRILVFSAHSSSHHRRSPPFLFLGAT